MKQKLELVALSLFVLSVIGLIWANTGSNVESGYTTCGGGGFIPQSSLPSGPGIYNGICLGQPVTKSVRGRYTNTNLLDVGLAAVALVSIAIYFLPRDKKRRKTSKR